MKMKKLSFLFLIFLILSISELSAQLDNSGLFYDLRNMDSSQVGDLNLEIYGLAFNKNNEYYEKTVTGYTLFGHLFRPELSYHLHKDFYVKIGIITRKDFGNNNFTLTQPTFLIRYDYKYFKFLFGTIRGPLEHNYLEPLYDFERIVSDNPENGLQVLFNSRYFDADAWISWNRTIYDRSPFREEFNGGASGSLKIVNNESFKLSIPLQWVVTHLGGQIDDDPEPARTVYNLGSGLNAYTEIGEGFINSLRFQGYFLTFNSLESTELIIPPFKDGYGYYLNLTINSHMGSVMLSYWNGDEFSAWNGGALYQSTSQNWREPFALQSEREIIILRLLNDIKLKNNLRIIPRMEPNYNIRDNKWGLSFGLYVRFQEYFKLLNTKPGNN